MNFEEEWRALFAAHHIALASALALAAAKHDKPKDELERSLSACVEAGRKTFADAAVRDRYNKELGLVFTRASLHLTDDRQTGP